MSEPATSSTSSETNAQLAPREARLARSRDRSAQRNCDEHTALNVGSRVEMNAIDQHVITDKATSDC